ncbi:Serine/threonine-protein kinase 4 [Balamuthia mandrillaris]
MAWIQPKAGCPIAARFGHTQNSIDEGNERAVLFGGEDGQRYFDDVYVLDMGLKWSKPSKLAAMLTPTGSNPSARSQHSATTVGQQLFVFGGFDGTSCLNDLFILDLENWSWRKGETSGDVPEARCGHTASLLNGTIIVLGGRNSTGTFLSLQEVYVLDTVALKWEKRTATGTAPSPRAWHTSSCVNEKIYTFGGANGKQCFGDMHMLEMKNSELAWIRLEHNEKHLPPSSITAVTSPAGGGADSTSQNSSRPPPPRCCHCAVVLGSTIIFHGGQDMYLQKPTLYNDLYLFFTNSRNWEYRQVKMSRTEGEPQAVAKMGMNLMMTTKVCVFGGIKERFYREGQNVGKRQIPSNDLTILYHLERFEEGWTVEQSQGYYSNTPEGGAVYHPGLPTNHSYPQIPEQHSIVRQRGQQLDAFLKHGPPSSHKGKPSLEPRSKSLGKLSKDQMYGIGIGSKDFTKLVNDLKAQNQQQFASPPRTQKEIKKERKERRKEEKRLERERKRNKAALRKKTLYREVSQLELMVSAPRNVSQKVHVGPDMQWSVVDPEQVFLKAQLLGEGAYGAVYKGVHRETEFVVAIKELPALEDDEDLKKEIDILKKCSHDNIVCYYGSCQTPTSFWILMDFCDIGSARDLIETCNKPLLEDQIAYILQQSIQGLIYLHGMNIIHRDVKAGNVLINGDGDVKIADFGVSEQLSDAVAKSRTRIGTPLWMAPEVIAGTQYGPRCDIWSLGITAIELADGLPPNYDMNPMTAMKLVATSPPPTLTDPSKFSSTFNNFISLCLIKDPAHRPDAAELLKHPFIRGAKGPSVLRGRISEYFQLKMKEQAKQASQETKEKTSQAAPSRNAASSAAAIAAIPVSSACTVAFATSTLSDDEEEEGGGEPSSLPSIGNFSTSLLYDSDSSSSEGESPTATLILNDESPNLSLRSNAAETLLVSADEDDDFGAMVAAQFGAHNSKSQPQQRAEKEEAKANRALFVDDDDDFDALIEAQFGGGAKQPLKSSVAQPKGGATHQEVKQQSGATVVLKGEEYVSKSHLEAELNKLETKLRQEFQRRLQEEVVRMKDEMVALLALVPSASPASGPKTEPKKAKVDDRKGKRRSQRLLKFGNVS